MFGKPFTTNEKRAILFVAPGLMVMLLLIIYPVASVIKLSFTDTVSGIKIFAGFDNYINVFNADRFVDVLKNTMVWVAATTLLAFFLGSFTALLLNQKFIRFRGFWRSVLMLSWITPGVVKATVWKWLYSYDFGMLNHMLTGSGILKEPVSWLTNTDYALMAVIVVQVWATFPFAALMISAALQSIPPEIYEVARLEGARGIKFVRFILLPMLRDVAFISILILVIWSLNEFSLIWIITQGGPAGSTQVLSLSIYERFRSFDINGASAIAVFQLIISMAFAGWYIIKVGNER